MSVRISSFQDETDIFAGCSLSATVAVTVDTDGKAITALAVAYKVPHQNFVFRAALSFE